MILRLGNCEEVLAGLDADSIDSIVTDPPYGWRFMGKAWDGDDITKMAAEATGSDPRVCADGIVRKPRQNNLAIAAGKYDLSDVGNTAFQKFSETWAREAFRVLKPGGHIIVFCGPRTYHRMASGVEDAGFEIRDQLQWLFGQGFPKSLNLGNGWGTALKPANEPILLARKPLSEKTVAANVLRWGTGGINVDGSRIGISPNDPNHRPGANVVDHDPSSIFGIGNARRGSLGTGRFPSNLLLDEEAAQMLDEQSGNRIGSASASVGKGKGFSQSGINIGGGQLNTKYSDSGGASRFFYVAKASTRERNAGLEGIPESVVNTYAGETARKLVFSGTQERLPTRNTHPTVKPIRLMEYLIRLITPPNGIVLDPFMGSGTTGIAAKNLGVQFMGIEKDAAYFDIAKRRIDYVG